jgi:uncharacterized protein (TIGR03067 family)
MKGVHSMRSILRLAAISFSLWICCSILRGDSSDEKNLMNRLNGEWVVVSAQIADFSISGTDEKPISIFSIDGGVIQCRPRIGLNLKSSYSIGSNGFNRSKAVTLTLDEYEEQNTRFVIDNSVTPVQFDLVTEGKKGTVNQLGICRLNGETLELCMSLQSQSRPVEFRATKSTILFRLKRVTEAPGLQRQQKTESVEISGQAPDR